jgi:hypothetical protein
MTLQVCVVVILIGKLLRAHEEHVLQVMTHALARRAKFIENTLDDRGMQAFKKDTMKLILPGHHLGH